MEQGPEELSDRGESRTEELEKMTDEPMDKQSSAPQQAGNPPTADTPKEGP